MRFAFPWRLWGLALVPALGLVAYGAFVLRRRRLGRFVSASLLPRLSVGASTGRFAAHSSLRIGAIAFLVVALARPQWGRKDEPAVRKGVDVVMALDLSASMLAEDVSPDRLEQARSEAVSLLHSLEGDRVALVVFGGRAVVQCPLTLDYGAVRLFLDAADVSFSPAGGTDLGRAIDEAARLLQDASGASERRYKTMVLLTDGEDLEGSVPEAVRKAREGGIVIHAIGVGTPRGGPIPIRNEAGTLVGYKKDPEGKVVTTRFDPTALEKIALETDGIFLHAGPAGDAGARIAEAISRMEKREIASRLASRFEDRYQFPLAAALILLGIEAAWIPRRRGILATGTPPGSPEPRAETPDGSKKLAVAALALGILGAGVASSARAASAALGTEPSAPQEARDGAGAPGKKIPGGSGRADAPLDAGRAPSAEIARKNREGNRLYGQKKYTEALSRYEEAGAAAPGLSALRYNIGNALFREGKYGEAASEYRRALQQARPEMAPAIRYNLGNAEYSQARYNDAVESYLKVLEKSPSDEAARRNLELALRALKKPQQQQPTPQSEKQDRSSKQDEKKGADAEKNPDPSRTAERRGEDQQGSKTGRGRSGEAGKIGRQEAEKLLDSLAEEEKGDLKRRLARMPRDAGRERDW